MEIEIKTIRELGLEVWIILQNGVEINRHMSRAKAESIAHMYARKYETTSILTDKGVIKVKKVA